MDYKGEGRKEKGERGPIRQLAEKEPACRGGKGKRQKANDKRD
jgi:hypothetical protein